ncbi:MAG: hypothetical protein KAJ75_01680 [Alphaproteobacteria bacterium]|nr:hypothetical protein [Alphaproteobacteria bacterium]
MIEFIGTFRQKKRLAKIVDRIEKSPHGKELLEKAGKAGFTIEMMGGIQAYGGMNPSKKIIILNEDVKDEQLMGTLAHECRHVGQCSNGMNSDVRRDSIKTFLMNESALEADANANAALVTWQLKEAGDNAPWEKFQLIYCDVANSFEESAKNGGAENGEAMSKAFKGWYKTTSTRELYEEVYVDKLNRVSQEIQNNPKTLSNVKTSEEIVKQVCRFGKDGCYFKDDPKILEKSPYLDVSDKTWKFLKEVTSIREGSEKAKEYMKKIPNRDEPSTDKMALNRFSAMKAHKSR